MIKYFYTVIILTSLLVSGRVCAAGANTAAHNKVVISGGEDWFLYSEALFFKSNRNYRKAIEYFEKSISSGKELHRVYYQIAHCYFSLHDYDKANQYAGRSIAADRTYESPYLLTYKIYLRLKNYNSASQILESLLEVKPGTSTFIIHLVIFIIII